MPEMRRTSSLSRPAGGAPGRQRSKSLDAIIVGAGFAGLYQLHSLRDRLGLDVRVIEAGDGVGGTWYWNRYPGARCDSESHVYCYSFSETLNGGWTFSERYPGQSEILRYLNYVADTLDLKRDITFSTRVTAAHYDDAGAVLARRDGCGRNADGEISDHGGRLLVVGEHAGHSGD